MRAIKFRAYNSAENEIGKVWSIDNTYIHYISKYPEPETMCRVSRCELILMQYTGLKDKNGIEIYDGDLIRNSVGEVYLVYYDAGTPFIHDISKDGDFEDVAMFMCSSFGKIIGNKYENKKLMENK